MVHDRRCHAPERSQAIVVMMYKMYALTEAACQAHAGLTARTVHTKPLLHPQFT